MAIDPSTVRRLAFVKYIYQLGVSQSQLPEPANASSVLILHDATELFLQLASEVLDVGKAQVDFLGYWDLINPELQPFVLPQQESYRRLNKCRVSLKHHGILPSAMDIVSFRTTAASFFEEATPVVFHVRFAEVSLVDFVESAEARSVLKEAASLLANGLPAQSTAKSSLAFHMLLDDYERGKRARDGRSPFSFGPDLRFLDSFSIGLDRHATQLLATPESLDKLGDFVDRVKESLEAVQHATRILALGIHYPRYCRFASLAPHVYMTYKCQYHVESPSPSLTAAQGQFCIDFVIEAALKLQEFDYSLESGYGVDAEPSTGADAPSVAL